MRNDSRGLDLDLGCDLSSNVSGDLHHGHLLALASPSMTVAMLTRWRGAEHRPAWPAAGARSSGAACHPGRAPASAGHPPPHLAFRSGLPDLRPDDKPSVSSAIGGRSGRSGRRRMASRLPSAGRYRWRNGRRASPSRQVAGSCAWSWLAPASSIWKRRILPVSVLGAARCIELHGSVDICRCDRCLDVIPQALGCVGVCGDAVSQRRTRLDDPAAVRSGAPITAHHSHISVREQGGLTSGPRRCSRPR